MNKTLRLGSLIPLLLLAAAQLGGCDSGDTPICATNADCAAGQTCNSGTCVGGLPQAGAGGSGSAGSGVAGSGTTAGSGVGGSGVPAGGSGAGGSGVPTAGSSVGGSSGGQVGTAGNAGSSTQGGSSGSGAGGAAGAAGAGGSGGSGNVVGQCKDDYWPAANNGSVTRYDFNQGTSLPACAYAITHKGNGSDGDWDTVEGISTGDGGYFGAMNTEDFKQGATCGACVEASYSGRKVLLTIVDECPIGSNPLCTKGHIDLSRKAIRQLEPNGSLENLKGVSWKYVKCPASGNVKARLHPNKNDNWQPVVVENGLYPITSVTLNGKNASRTGNTSGGNAWVVDGQKAPYTVHATDVNGNAITFQYSGDGGLKDVGQQFMCK